MFPKFLRVTPAGTHIFSERINESTIIYKERPFRRDVLQLNVLADALGFSYRYVFAPVGYENILKNGNWTGVYGMLQRGETDLIFGAFEMDEKANKYLRLSYPHSVSDYTFIARKPEHVPNPAVFLHPFSIQVWLAIIACVCLLPFILHYLLRRKHSALNLFTSTLGSLVGQGMGQVPEKLGEYLVLGSWYLGSALLYYFYAAVLLSFVTCPSLHGVRTIDDLAKGIQDGKYQCSMHPGGYLERYFLTIDNPSFHVIANCLQENQQKRTGEFLEFLETPGEVKKPAYVGVRALFLPLNEFYFISKESFRSTSLVFAMHKDFCCVSEVDKVIHRIWATGIFQKFEASYNLWSTLLYVRAFGKYWHNPPSEAQLTMAMLKGPFIFLIASHSMAFLVFLMEVCIGKLKASGRFQNFKFEKMLSTA